MEVSMPEAHKRAYRHPKYKTSYRVKNWPEYEKSLRIRMMMLRSWKLQLVVLS